MIVLIYVWEWVNICYGWLTGHNYVRVFVKVLEFERAGRSIIIMFSCECVSVLTFTYKCLIYIYVFLWEKIWARVCMYVCVHARVYGFEVMHTRRYMFVSLCLCLCVNVCMHVHIRAHIRGLMCVYICWYMCFLACMWSYSFVHRNSRSSNVVYSCIWLYSCVCV